jgi:hypothetical protein
MGRADYYKHGDNNCLCDRCGRKRKASTLRATWDGLMVCRDTCWEPRHPQDFVRGKPERIAPDVLRPEPPDSFVDI